MRCSVVIPVRNMAAWVGEAIGSVLAQEGVEVDVVVVDDGSTDGSGDVAQRYPGVKVLRQERAGDAAARNRGFAEVHADAVMFLDADDRLRPGALARLLAALAADPAAAGAYGEVVAMDRDGRVHGTGRPPLFTRRPSGDLLRAFLRGFCFPAPGAACLRRDRLERAGPWRAVPLSKDWELWCRLALEGTFVYVPGPPVLEYRSHPASQTATKAEEIGNALPAIEAAFKNPRIRARFAERELSRLRRLRIAGAHAHAGRAALKNGRFGVARGHLLRCLSASPWRPREAILLAAAALRWLPGPLRRRIK